MIDLNIFYLYIGISVLILCPHFCCSKRETEHFVIGLQGRLEQFESCNVRITTEFNTLDFESFTIPVALLDLQNRRNIWMVEPIWDISTHRATHLFHFKFRSLRCSLDLILSLSPAPYDNLIYHHFDFQRREYMEDKYLIVIRQHSAFLAEDQQKIWDSNSVLPSLRVFIWTVTFDTVATKSIRLNETYFICRICNLLLPLNCSVYVSHLFYILECPSVCPSVRLSVCPSVRLSVRDNLDSGWRYRKV